MGSRKEIISELRAMILEEHSSAQRDRIIHWVGKQQARFDALMELFFANEKVITQRAAWPVSFIAIEKPQLIAKHLPALVENLQKPHLHQAVKRNSLRLLQEMQVPESLHGMLMDACLRFVEDVQETVAVKAFALTSLQNLSQQYPEIVPEIRMLVEAQWERQTPAFRVRARPFLQKPF